MNASTTILVGLSNPRTAGGLVRIGIDLARARSARLVIVSVVLVPADQSLSTGAKPARTQRRLLRGALATAEAAGVAAETIVRAGYAVDEALTEVVAEIDADLLIVGWAPTPHYGQPADSPAWRLSQEPPCNILSVRAYEDRPAPRRILLPVRGGRHADLAADLAVSLARGWGATVTVLRVIPEYVPRDEAAHEQLAFATLWESRYPGAVEARSVTASSVRECILEESAAHDLLVLGGAAEGRSFPYPFGRLSEEIAERAACPVLIARTEQPMTVEDMSSDYRSVSPGAPASGHPIDISRVVDKWFAENTYHSKEFANIAELVRLKEQQGLTVSLVLPALNEEETIGQIIETLQENLQRRHPLVDEMILIDSRSQDRTVAIARARGVTVYVHQDLLPEAGSYHGKGEALWKSLSVAGGDIVAWIDTDIVNIHPKFVYGLLGPLLKEPRIGYVKGFYRRPLRQGSMLQEASGGRVTELMARPIINLFYPLLSGLIQPLSGEYAGRREVLEQIPFQTGYGVEIGMLIDILERFGLQAIAQVDLERRVHRNQSLAALSRMSFTILQTVITRLERQRHIELVAPVNRSMKLIEQTREHFHLNVREIEEHERPPMADLRLVAEAR